MRLLAKIKNTYFQGISMKLEALVVNLNDAKVSAGRMALASSAFSKGPAPALCA